jgi:hypothetical protein
MNTLDPLHMDMEEEVVEDHVRELWILPHQGHPQKLQINHATHYFMESQDDRVTMIILQGKLHLLALYAYQCHRQV